MENTRYEVQITTFKGRAYARIYDNYWDTTSYGIYDRYHPETCTIGDASTIKALATVLDGMPDGWYAIKVEDFPFGELGNIYDIPGRNKRYA